MDALFAASVSQLRDGAKGQVMVRVRREQAMHFRDRQRRKVVITAIILSAIVLAFYIATFIRHWS